MISARRMVDKIQLLVEDLIRECGYSLVFCGHSLGASAATLAAILLRSRIPQLAKDASDQRVRVYAFGPLSVLDPDSSVAAALFCTSIVNNADIVPRSSLANLMVFMKLLRNGHVRLLTQ
jgi:predicted lipase